MGITIEEENIVVYISGYICRKVSPSACDQCKVILLPIINGIHFCVFEYSGCVVFVPRPNLIQLIGSNEQILHRRHKRYQIIIYKRIYFACFGLPK